MGNAFHKNLINTDIHVPITWTYADKTARESATGFVTSDLHKFARQADKNSIWMLITTDPIWINISGENESLIFQAGRDSVNVTNSYLYTQEIPNNITPLILPFNCTLTAISAATRGNETWVVEVRKSLSLVTGATLSITNTDSGYIEKNIDFDAGDKIGIYCNGNKIDRPLVTIVFRRRV